MGETFLESRLAPRAVLLGIVAGFTSCCLLGYLGPRTNIYTDFGRFHVHVSPSTQYFPTASQMRTLGQEQLKKDKTLVIVSGSSVFYGTGQSDEQLWTRRLQEELGDDFVVLNLAMPAGNPQEFGSLAVEMLSRDYEQVTNVAPQSFHGSTPDPDGYQYRYLYWDAFIKGLLPPNPERESRMAEIVKDRIKDPKTGDAFREFLRQVHCDRFLRFQDCWTRIAYEDIGTVWTPYLDRSFLKPRRSFGDQTPPASPLQHRYPPHEYDQAMAIVRRADLATTCIPRYTVMLQFQFPPPHRQRTLLVAVPHSPYYLQRLNPKEQEVYYSFFSTYVRVLEEAGFPAFNACIDFTEAD